MVRDSFRPRSDVRLVRAAARSAREQAGSAGTPVSLLLTDDAEIAELHARFLGDATPTDVISFAYDGAIEVVVSVECARRTARELGHTIRAELALYVVHGVLHGCGFDDTTRAARARMRRAERAVLDRLGLRVRPVDE